MSGRVIGAAVKAAVRSAADKQVRAAGLFPGRTNVTFMGRGAYAGYSSNGSRVDYRINYPAMPDECVLTRAEADLIAAFTLHETGHIIFTDNSAARYSVGGARLHKVWNGFEDGRMEAAVITTRAAGARQLFRRLLNKLTSEITPQFNPCAINDAPFTLALLCREALGNGNAFTATLLDRIPEPKRSIYESAMQSTRAMSLDRAGSHKSMEAAVQFLKAWDEVAEQVTIAPPPEPTPQPSKPDEKEQEAYWKEDGEDEPEAEDDEFEDQPDVEFQPKQRDADEREADIPSGEGEPGDDEWGEPGESDEEESDEESGESDESDESGDEESDESDGGAGGVGEPADDFSDDQSAFSDSKSRSPEPSIDDLFKRLSKRSKKSPLDMDDAPAAQRTNDASYRVENSYKRFGNPLPEINDVAPGLKAQLTRLLLSVDRVGWDAGATSGRFDVRRTSRMLAGSERVFKTRWEQEAIETAVSIVLDLSGSMSVPDSATGVTRIGAAVDCAYAIAQVCEQVSAKVEIVGFKNGGTSTAKLADMFGEQAKGTREYDGAACLLDLKRFDQRLRDAKDTVAYAKASADSGTPDYHAVRSVVESLSTVPANRKIVIVLTDGMGHANKMKFLTENSERLFGVQVLGIGINVEQWHMAQSYRYATVVKNVGELGGVALRTLIKEVERGAKQALKAA